MATLHTRTRGDLDVYASPASGQIVVGILGAGNMTLEPAEASALAAQLVVAQSDLESGQATQP